MKKLFTILALALAMVACQKDGDVNVTNGDLATVTLNLNAPALDVTRADENGEDDSVNGKESAYGAIDYADAAFWAKYDLRYILEVYDENDNGTGTNIAAARQYKYVDEYEQTTFEVKLVPNRKYKFVVWADFVKEDNRTDDLYYNTADLRQISIITTAEGFNAMNEARDAYFITQNLEIKKDVDQTLVLKRPLAKLRVVTTDKQHWAKYSTPAQVVVKYYDSALSNVFNAVNGNIDATNSPLQQLTYDVTYATAASQYNETTDNKTLFTDYLFAIPGAHIPVHFTMDVLESDGRLIRSNDFNTEIPIERNHLTTIYGDILTTATDIKVGINDNFDKEKPIDYDEKWSNDNANQTPSLTPEGTVNGKTDVAYDNNGGYTITSVEGIDVTIAASTLKNGQLAAGVYNYGTDFTVADFQYTIPAAGTAAVKFEANTVTAKVTGGTMEVLVSTEGTQTINLDLDIEYATTEGAKPEQAKVEYTMESTFVFEEIELEALATPVVEAAVEGNVVTLTWAAVENAASYSITVGTEMPVFVEETTYVFTGEYETEYTFNVVAVPADEEKFAVSEAGVATATTEAAPVAEKPEAGSLVTIAQYIELADTEVAYQISGVISNIYNTNYGNFYLTDETGTITVYGLLNRDGGKTGAVADYGIREGDTVTLEGVYKLYDTDTHEIVNAILKDHVAAPYIEAKAVSVEASAVEATINVSANVAWTVTCDAEATWVTSYTQSGENSGTISVVMEANELEESRSATFTLSAEGLEPVTVTLTQRAKPAAGVVEGGRSDFNTISATNTSYVSGTTTAGWAYTNCAIFKGGTANSGAEFAMIGDASNRALCMNGKTTAQGTITSPTITTGCGTLKFNYGLPFSDTKIKFTVDIIQNGEVVKTFTVENLSATKQTKYSFEETVDVTGEFQIAFKNLSPSNNSSSNKDRTAIWDVEWTGKN